MNPIKIAVSGPVGAGKTTLIKSVSHTEVICTDEAATEKIGKDFTTVAMDFGSFMADDCQVLLFGTPGQERFDFMWEILCKGAIGLVLMIAGDRPQDFVKARNILEFITSQLPVPFVIGVSRQDRQRVWTPEEVAEYFELPVRQVIGLDARDPAQGYNLLFQLLQLVQEHNPLGAVAHGGPRQARLNKKSTS